MLGNVVPLSTQLFAIFQLPLSNLVFQYKLQNVLHHMSYLKPCLITIIKVISQNTHIDRLLILIINNRD